MLQRVKKELPDFLSSGLENAGFYTFRNGWKDKATVMIVKAGPPGEFHAQPDNGTFELWVKGRNFTPDTGCYIYSGDAEITNKETGTAKQESTRLLHSTTKIW